MGRDGEGRKERGMKGDLKKASEGRNGCRCLSYVAFFRFLHAAAVYTMAQHLTHCYRPSIQVRSVELKKTTFLGSDSQWCSLKKSKLDAAWSIVTATARRQRVGQDGLHGKGQECDALPTSTEGCEGLRKGAPQSMQAGSI